MICQATIKHKSVPFNSPAQGYGTELFVKEGKVLSISEDGKTLTVEKTTIVCKPAPKYSEGK